MHARVLHVRDLDKLIAGGGIHGVHIAVRSLGDAGVSPEGSSIIDPAARPRDRWRTCAATAGPSTRPEAAIAVREVMQSSC